jgi:hypothetical protein
MIWIKHYIDGTMTVFLALASIGTLPLHGEPFPYVFKA